MSMEASCACPAEGAHAARRMGATWLDVSWLMLSDVVGTSVLVFPGVAEKLGWVLSVVLIVGLFPISLYVSVLMARTRQLLSEEAAQQTPEGPPPSLGSMGEVACRAFGVRSGVVTYIAVYGFNLLGQASYLLVLGTSVQQVIWPTPICINVAIALGCAGLMVPIFAVRRLVDSILLCFFNTLLILAVVVVALVHLASLNRRVCTRTFLFPPDLTMMTVLGQATNVIFAYTGQWMYFELMETMAVPGDFPRAFAVTGPFMITLYLAVALLGYELGAGDADLLAGMEAGGALHAAAAMLFLHVAIVYLIKSVVLARFFHSLCHPTDLDAITPTAYLRHGGFGLVMLSGGYVVANAVPFFSQLLGLIGGFLAGPINFLLPISFYLTVLARHVSVRTAVPAGADTAAGIVNGDDTYGSCAALGDSAPPPHDQLPKRLAVALRSLPAWELALLAATTVLTVMTMVVGVADQVRQVVELNQSRGAPFSCHGLLEPGTSSAPVCSAAKVGRNT